MKNPANTPTWHVRWREAGQTKLSRSAVSVADDPVEALIECQKLPLTAIEVNVILEHDPRNPGHGTR